MKSPTWLEVSHINASSPGLRLDEKHFELVITADQVLEFFRRNGRLSGLDAQMVSEYVKRAFEFLYCNEAWSTGFRIDTSKSWVDSHNCYVRLAIRILAWVFSGEIRFKTPVSRGRRKASYLRPKFGGNPFLVLPEAFLEKFIEVARATVGDEA